MNEAFPKNLKQNKMFCYALSQLKRHPQLMRHTCLGVLCACVPAFFWPVHFQKLQHDKGRGEKLEEAVFNEKAWKSPLNVCSMQLGCRGCHRV